MINRTLNRTNVLSLSCLIMFAMAGCPATLDDPGHREDTTNEEEHQEDEHVEVSAETMTEFGIEVAEAKAGVIRVIRELPGEVVFNPDRVAHVLPRVSGVVREVNHSIGDTVEEDEILAVLDSRELAQSITAYLAAMARQNLAQLNFSREKRLYDEKISSERSFLEARQVFEEARIETTRTKRELHALGMNEDDIAMLPEMPEENYTRFPLTAPISGMITERHLVRGEIVSIDTAEPPFVIADLSNVWVNLTVYARDQGSIKMGQQVVVQAMIGDTSTQGVIDFISPTMDEATRTGTARIVIENTERQWRPGQFVTGMVIVEEIEAPIVVPRTALQIIDGRTVIFVEEEEGVFEPRTVTAGTANEASVAIRSGLEAGERYVAVGGFALKAELNKASFEGDGHAH